ncbi:unnamed protein product [Amoebophrya sp. A120]|nr:unnamed protein product [Amoebophrya sp. A120]|eukprot:GSA120T00010978001.1
MRVSRRALLASAGAGLVQAAPGAAYTTLTTLFEKLKGEAKGEFDTKTPELADHNVDCKDALETIQKEIEKQTKDKTEAEAAEADAQKAIEGAEAKKAKEEQLKDAAETSKAGAQATYEKTKARMGYDMGQLQGATKGLDDAMTKIKADTTLADSTKSKLASTMSLLRDKMLEDQKKLDDDITMGEKFHAEAQTTMQLQIEAHDGAIQELTIFLSNEGEKLDAAKKAKADAISNLNAEKASKKAKTASCAEKRMALEGEIEDADNRVKALSAALDILGKPSAAAALLQAEKTILLQQKTVVPGFLQMRSAPNKVVLDLLATMSGKSRAAEMLKLALDQKPGAADAFAKIASEIDKLSDTMYKQQEEDQKSKTWCQQKDNELTLRIQDLETTKEELEQAIEALDNTASSHKDKAEQATTDINKAVEDNVKAHDQLTQDLDANKVEQEQLKEDFGNLEQAKIALTNVFKGRTESGGEIVLNEVDKVIEKYQAAMTESERVEKELGAAIENEEEDHQTNLKRLQLIEKRNKLGFKDNTAKSLSKSDDLRVVQSDLDTTKATMVKVVTGDDAKCKDYKSMYASRMEARKIGKKTSLGSSLEDKKSSTSEVFIELEVLLRCN